MKYKIIKNGLDEYFIEPLNGVTRIGYSSRYAWNRLLDKYNSVEECEQKINELEEGYKKSVLADIYTDIKIIGKDE